MDTGSFAGFDLTQREQGIAWFEFNTPERLNGMTAGVKRCLLYTSPSPRDLSTSRMPSSA